MVLETLWATESRDPVLQGCFAPEDHAAARTRRSLVKGQNTFVQSLSSFLALM